MDEELDVAGDKEAAAFVAFAGVDRIAVGTLAETAVAAKRATDRNEHRAVLVFNPTTGAVMDLDLRGTEAEIVGRYEPASSAAAKRGRPKLGVVAREVTLLPRHWDWLATQPGGASVTLRRLVETVRKLDSRYPSGDDHWSRRLFAIDSGLSLPPPG